MDYDDLLQIKTKFGFLIIIFSLTFITVGIYLLSLSIKDSLTIKGIYQDGFIYLNIPIDYSDTIKNGDYIKINKKKYTYEVKEISEMQVDMNNLMNYQVFTIFVDEEFLNNEVIDITVYYNEEKVIEKIKRIL